MAKNPKVKDPTEVALSAIQEALNIGDLPESDSGRDNHLRNEPSLGAASRGCRPRHPHAALQQLTQVQQVQRRFQPAVPQRHQPAAMGPAP